MTANEPEGELLLAVDSLSVGFRSADGHTPALDEVSFNVRAGECVGLVGESGCGKSLTGSAIMGLLPETASITSGSCSFKGKPIASGGFNDYRASRGSDVAIIFQESAASLDPNYTVGSQLLEVVRRRSGNSSSRAQKDEVLELARSVHLPRPESVLSSFPHELSGGMAQRVAIAAALAGNPSVLIADEPTTALDVTVQAEILNLLEEIQEKTQLGIVLISHDWGVIARLSTSVLVMYSGQVVESGPVGEIFDSPRHPYTQALMRSNPHHVARAHEPLTTIPGTVPALGAWPVGCHFAPRCQFATAACKSGRIDESYESGHRVRCIHQAELPAFALGRTNDGNSSDAPRS